MQNTSISTNMKIGNIFWFSTLKKDRHILLLVIEINNAKMTNMLIKEQLVLDHTLYGCMRYNPAYKIKQCFNCYKYNHVLVYYQKNIKCKVYLSLHKTLKYFQNKV